MNHHLLGFPVLTVAALAIASVQALRAYFSGSSMLLGAVRAHELASESAKAQAVADVVNEMALAARIPVPRLRMIDDPAPNAFAAGRDPAHSVICVTRGLIDQLDREEMQGVIAHEMAHIRGHDTRITQMATVMVGGFALVSGSMWRTAAAQRRGDKAAIPGFGLVALPVLIIGCVGWLFAKLAAITLSREREYLADASAVEFTRNPTALDPRARTYRADRIATEVRRCGVAPLFIVDPFECGGTSWSEYLDEVARIESQQDKSKEQRDAEVAQYMAKGAPPSLFAGVFSSHPPIHDRIMRLQGLLHQDSGAPAESADELRARRKAAADGESGNGGESGGDGRGVGHDAGGEAGAADRARAGREHGAGERKRRSRLRRRSKARPAPTRPRRSTRSFTRTISDSRATALKWKRSNRGIRRSKRCLAGNR